MTVEERAQLPASEDMYELHFFNMMDMRSDKLLFPSFEESLVVHKDFDIKNEKYQQSLFLNDSLDVLGPLHKTDRFNFSFVRSYVKHSAPISPARQTLATVKYPCIMHCTPYLKRNKIFIQNFYFPEDIHILDLGKWKLVCFVENCLAIEDGGQT